ncbi:BLUF domain-containing protein [Hymenobacter metallicola]|uniref:BLUF domain-containing protein n=1 Tax=Hymenobacter metallicola TaxID=2563114 RepID=A0A4Z0QH52_9BACT|nr:BLUF domain-containing protein [Hymenobacter metallicola]TGE29074.1 BLUF domain-containing protein [Hymenobacter metallicola]
MLLSPPASLYHLAYQSTATGMPTEQDLEELLVQARATNQQHGLTGVLLYCEGRFMQVLEGSEEAVQGIYARIERDLRHHNVIKFTDGPIRRRSFSTWSMGFKAVHPEDFQHLACYLNPAAPSFPPTVPETDTSTLHALLASFLTDESIRY